MKAIALKINEYLPKCKTITMYASTSNIKNKSVEQLIELRSMGVNNFIYRSRIRR